MKIKVIDFLDMIYNRKKDGSINHHSSKLIEKHSLNIEEEIDVSQAILIASTLSNTEKRIKVIDKLLSLKEKKEQMTMELRKHTYKQVCRHYHPDNLETGSENVFKFIQEIKEVFWDYLGNPRKMLINLSWDKEKERKEFKGTDFEWSMKMWDKSKK